MLESLGCFLPHKVPYFQWKTPMGQAGFCGPGRSWLRKQGLGWRHTYSLIAETGTLWNCVSSVINELDGLAKGQETDHRAGGYARVVQEKARKSIEFLERRFESRDSCLRALTSRGNELESIAFRSEDITGQLVRSSSRKGVPIASLQNRVSRGGEAKGKSVTLGN